MCQSKASGGRRCPSYHNPEHRATVNRKRRERFWRTRLLETTTFPLTTRYTVDRPGELYNTVIADSNKDTQQLTLAQKNILRAYTNQLHEPLNGILYGNYPLLDSTGKEFTVKTSGEYETDELYNQKFNLSTVTSENFQHFVDVLDEVLLNTPNTKPRKLYRALSPAYMSKGELLVNRFRKEHQPGAVINFPGYLSTSLSTDFIRKRLNDNAIVYEILTNQGLNVANLSEYKTEAEVLLPRGGTYRVVGYHQDTPIEDISHHNITVIQLVPVFE